MHIVLDPSDTRTLPVRIAEAIRNQVAAGILTPGEEVESTRELAARLDISRGSVVAAYDQLAGEGYLISATGSGTYINPHLPHVQLTPPLQAPDNTTQAPLLELTPGRPDTAGILTPEWRAAWRSAAASPLGTIPPAGLDELRAEVTEHLRHMRGLAVNPAHVMITAGARDGLATLLRARARAEQGASTKAGQSASQLRVGVESPGYPSLRRIPAELGFKVVEVRTDAEGITIPATALDGLIVTPSHQYPYGGSLPAQRRGQLVEWARTNGALLIEDDFDSELRYTGQPLPALTALAPESTALLGTFSSLISPSIACGYAVIPEDMRADFLACRSVFGLPVGAIPQAALAHYLASGALRRHTARMRRAYRRRRDLVTTLFAQVPGAHLLPISGGLHAVVLCEANSGEVVERVASQGVAVTALRDYWGASSALGADNGIVFGFGHLPEEELKAALQVVVANLHM